MISNLKRCDLYQHARSRATNRSQTHNKTTSAACRRKDTRHTRGAKAGGSLLENGKDNFLFFFLFKIKLAASILFWREGGSWSTRRKPSVTRKVSYLDHKFLAPCGDRTRDLRHRKPALIHCATSHPS